MRKLEGGWITEKAVTEKDLNGAAELCLLGTGEGDINNSFS